MQKQYSFSKEDLVYIHSGKKLAVINGQEILWTSNIRKASVVAFAEAQALMRNNGCKNLWYEPAHPFNAIIRLKHGDETLYVERQTPKGFWLVRTLSKAYRYKDSVSAESVLKKYRRPFEERGFTLEVVIAE